MSDLESELTEAAASDYPAPRVARVLREIAARIESEHGGPRAAAFEHLAEEVGFAEDADVEDRPRLLLLRLARSVRARGQHALAERIEAMVGCS